ncbi:hypothetical protein FRB94_000711 [Tulasnella sp. JGI-2019a]|nr:hypothetical protein FRB93_003028 [Tulasnella sp. JGI-2019a]KAG9006401.1 hypothetical protein FRB94_000711 [Tulasnella sp. JGI-2019a]
MRLRSAGNLPRSQTIPPTHHFVHSTTHDATHIPELLLRYFGYLTRAELVNTAIVCSSWSILAIDTLWCHHEVPLSALLSLLPFLHKRPIKIRRHENDEKNEDDPDSDFIQGGWYPMMEQPIDTPTWNLLLNKYAYKVTRLLLDTALRGPSVRLLTTLLDKSAGPVLCPNVRSLRIVMRAHSERLHAMAIPILCGSSVTNVEVKDFCIVVSDPVRFAEHLGTAFQICGSQIRCFKLGSSRGSSYTFTPDFSLFDRLTKVHLRNLTREGWQKLAENCPHLLEVSLTEVLEEMRRPTPNGDLAKSIDFPLLRKLSINSTTLVNGILSESNMPALERLVVGTHVYDGNGTISMQLAKRSSLLQEVELCIMQPDGVGLIITALSSLCRLRKLKLSGETSEWDMTDSHMNALARSAPNLRSISITFERRSYSRTEKKIHITRATLLSLVQHCRQLVEIELPMDLSNADVPRKKLVGFTPSTTVTSLKFWEAVLPPKFSRSSHIKFLDGIVHFLIGCCPEVRVFGAHEQNTGVVRPGIEQRFRKYLEDKWRVISTYVAQK